jgi:hypothetical protein
LVSATLGEHVVGRFGVVEVDRRSATPLGGCPGAGGQRAAKISQATLELLGEIWIDGRLPVGVAARWLGPGLVGFVDAERCVQQAVGTGRAGALGDEEQYASIRCLEDGQQAPCAVQVKPADSRQGFSGQPDACRRASAVAYVLDAKRNEALTPPRRAAICSRASLSGQSGQSG